MAILYADTVSTMTSGPAAIGDTVILGGYYTLGDGGGGYFLCISPSGTPDEGLLFQNGSGSVYFQRIVNTPYISVKWFGAYGDNFNPDDVAINRAFRSTNLGNTILIDGQDASRTRIYFPAGIYILENPIAGLDAFGMVPYELQGLEIIGERAVLRTTDATTFGTDFAMWVKPIGSLALRGITFKEFKNALKLENSTDVSNTVLDCVNFEDHSVLALYYDCPEGTFTIDNGAWANCELALDLQHGDMTIRTSTFARSNWSADNSYFIGINNTSALSIKNSVFIPPPNYYNAYANTATWIRCNGGSFRAVNTRFNGSATPLFSNGIAHILTNVATGRQWTNSNAEIRIIFRDCFCDSSRSIVDLQEMPNVLIFKNNMGFSGRSMLFQYTGSSPLQTELDKMYALLSIEVDNVPIYGTPLWQSNKIYSLTQPNNVFPVPYKDQLKFLPYFRINAGLDSFGYVENFDYPSIPSILKFFMGRQSYDVSDSNNSAIYGDCSFEVKLTSVTSYDPTQGNFKEGELCLCNNYRVNCRVVGGVTIIDSIVQFGPVDFSGWAPLLWQDPGDGLLKVTTQANERYGIYYQIRNLIPPVIEAYPG